MPQVFLGKKVRKAVVTGNPLRGDERIENQAGTSKNIVVQDNASE
ncbi:hypothetical protein FACS1894189_1400 [Planctomycetales bacterium]|nr:hypothetical protein FACS1894189_1400 [Planctomycetales bacterium]